MFLDAHPGWTWSDLQAAPVRVVWALNRINAAKVRAAKAAAARAEG